MAVAFGIFATLLSVVIASAFDHGASAGSLNGWCESVRARRPELGEGVGSVILIKTSSFASEFIISAAFKDPQPNLSHVDKIPPESIPGFLLRRAALPWTHGDRAWPPPGFSDMRLLAARGWPWPAFWHEEASSNPSTTTGLGTFGSFRRPNRTYPGALHFKDWASLSSAGGVPEPLVIPYRPLWLGLIADSLFYATIWFAAATLLAFTRRRLRRHRDGCTACGYSLTGLAPGAPCPECGSA